VRLKFQAGMPKPDAGETRLSILFGDDRFLRIFSEQQLAYELKRKRQYFDLIANYLAMLQS